MSVAKNSMWFALGTVISRFSGLARDIIVASVFGTSGLFDAFVIAFRIPNLLRDMLAEGALGGAFTSVYSSVSEISQERAERLLIDTLRLAFLMSAVVSALGILLAPQLVDLMMLMAKKTAGTEEMIRQTTGLTRLMFPYLIFTVLGAVLMGALHQHNGFFLSAVSPIGFNVGNILGAIAISPILVHWAPDFTSQWIAEPTITGLSIGVLIGGAAQLVMQAAGLWKRSLRKHLFTAWHNPWTEDTKRTVMLMIPATIAASAGPVNLYISSNYATSLGTGAVSWLYYAFRLFHLPIGIFGVAISSASLPALSRAITRAGRKVDAAVSRELQNSSELVLWFMAPCMVYLLGNSLWMVRLLFQYGKFDEASTIGTAEALQAYSIGLIGYGLLKVLTSFYYAIGRTSFAMRVSLASIFLNALGGYVFTQALGHDGLALTSSVTLSCNAIFLMAGLRHDRLQLDRSAILKAFWMLAGGTAVSLLVQNQIVKLVVYAAPSLDMGPKVQSFAILAINGLLVFGLFLMLGAWRLKVGPQEMWQLIKSRGRRARK